MLKSTVNIIQSFKFRKSSKDASLSNVYICESSVVMRRADAQNGFYSIFGFYLFQEIYCLTQAIFIFLRIWDFTVY